MRETDIKECHRTLLENAKVLDAICRKHGIPYFMLGGTMLGAVRHGGFIPWDDDMDFGVPREYYETLGGILERELPPHLKCRTYANSDSIFYGFMKLGDADGQTGIDIDIFPLDRCARNGIRLSCAYALIRLQTLLFVSSTRNTWYKSLIKRTLRAIAPFNHRFLPRRIDRALAELPGGEYLANVYGRWKKREIIPFAWYGPGRSYAFEDTRFPGLEAYDAYLSKLYGDYRTIPPEGERLTHGPYFTLEQDQCRTDFERWIYILKHMDTLERMPFKVRISVLEKLLDIADVSKLDEKERARYDEALKIYRDYYGTIHSAERKGKAEGLAEGMAKGEAKGLAKGEAQMRIAASKMKKKGLSTPDIIQITGLTPEEIENL